MVTEIDLNDIDNAFDQVDKIVYSLKSIPDLMNNDYLLIELIAQRKDALLEQYKSLSSLGNFIENSYEDDDLYESEMTKRGLFDAVGYASSYLFGTGSPAFNAKMVKFYDVAGAKFDKIHRIQTSLQMQVSYNSETIESQAKEISELQFLITDQSTEIARLEAFQLGIQGASLLFDQIEAVVHKISMTLIDGKMHRLNNFAIPPSDLKTALSAILLKKSGFSIPFEQEHVSNYYFAKLTQVIKEGNLIKVFVKIPLLDKNEKLELELASPSDMYPTHEQPYILKYDNGDYRFLTREDYSKCHHMGEHSLMCPKRHIPIKNTATISCQDITNCGINENIYVYDLTHTHISLRVPNNTQIAVKCDSHQETYILPEFSNIYLPDKCQLLSDKIFIDKIRHVPDISVQNRPSPPVHLNFSDYSMQHKMKSFYQRNMDELDRTKNQIDKKWSLLDEVQRKTKKELSEHKWSTLDQADSMTTLINSHGILIYSFLFALLVTTTLLLIKLCKSSCTKKRDIATTHSYIEQMPNKKIEDQILKHAKKGVDEYITEQKLEINYNRIIQDLEPSVKTILLNKFLDEKEDMIHKTIETLRTFNIRGLSQYCCRTPSQMLICEEIELKLELGIPGVSN